MRPSGTQALSGTTGGAPPSTSYALLALSPVFEVGTPGVGTPGASLSVSDGTVAESAEPPSMRFTVSLSEPVERTVRVRVRTRESDPPSASYLRDFWPFRRDLAFQPGETEKHVWVRVLPDSQLEGPETFELELLRAEGAPISDGVGVGVITDAATPAAVTVSRAAVTVTEGGDAARYSVAVSTPPGPGETVTVTATPDDAAVQVNGGASAALSFTAGNWTEPRTVTVTALDDTDMDNESVGIAHTVSGPPPWSGLAPPSVSAVVNDDDAPPGPPVVNFVRANSSVGEADGTATVSVMLSTPPAAELPLAYTVGGTATAATDYTAPAGAAEVGIEVAVTDDALDEPDETVALTLVAGAGYTLGDVDEHTVTDDDVPPPTMPAVSIATATATAAEAGQASFTLTAAQAPAGDLAVTVDVADVPGSDFVAAADEGARTLTIPAGQTSVSFNVAIAPGGTLNFIGGPESTRVARLTITTRGDSRDEGAGETLTVSLGSPGGNLDGGASVSAGITFRIADDDEPLPVATITGGSPITEGGDAMFTVGVSPAPAANLTVWVDVSDAHASDFLPDGATGRKPVVVQSGQGSATLAVATRQDDDEPDGTVRAALAPGAGYRVGAASSASVAVSDDDATALATLSIGDARQAEGGGQRSQFDPDVTLMEFAIRLSAAQRHTVRVTATTRDSTPVSARAGHDYTPARLLAEFPPGGTMAHVWVRIVDDSHDEGDETFELVLSNPRGAAIGDGTAVATITNDDPMPAAWLSRFGRTVAEQALDGTAVRGGRGPCGRRAAGLWRDRRAGAGRCRAEPPRRPGPAWRRGPRPRPGQRTRRAAPRSGVRGGLRAVARHDGARGAAGRRFLADRRDGRLGRQHGVLGPGGAGAFRRRRGDVLARRRGRHGPAGRRLRAGPVAGGPGARAERRRGRLPRHRLGPPALRPGLPRGGGSAVRGRRAGGRRPRVGVADRSDPLRGVAGVGASEALGRGGLRRRRGDAQDRHGRQPRLRHRVAHGGGGAQGRPAGAGVRVGPSAGADLGRLVDADLLGENPRPGGVELRLHPAQARAGGKLAPRHGGRRPCRAEARNRRAP